MASLLAYGAGSGEGLDEALKNEILKERMAEEIRHNQATEADARQTHADYALSRQDANKERVDAQTMAGANARAIGGVVSDPQHTKELGAGVPDDRYQSNVGPANIPSTIGLQTIKPPTTDTTPVDAPHMVNSIPVANSPDFWTNKGGEAQQLAQRKQDFVEGKVGNGAPAVNSEVKTVIYKGRPVDASYHPREDKYYLKGQDITADVQHYTAPTPFIKVESGADQLLVDPRNPGRKARPILGPDGQPIKPKASAQILNREDMAGRVGDHIPETQQQIDEAERKGLLGPISGRTMSQFLNEGWGSTGNAENDDLLSALHMNLSMLATGVASLHGRNGANQGIAADLKTMLNQNKMSHAGLTSALRTMGKWTSGYAAPAGNSGAAGGGMPKVGDTFQGGKVLKITPVGN